MTWLDEDLHLGTRYGLEAPYVSWYFLWGVDGQLRNKDDYWISYEKMIQKEPILWYKVHIYPNVSNVSILHTFAYDLCFEESLSMSLERFPLFTCLHSLFILSSPWPVLTRRSLSHKLPSPHVSEPTPREKPEIATHGVVQFFLWPFHVPITFDHPIGDSRINRSRLGGACLCNCLCHPVPLVSS